MISTYMPPSREVENDGRRPEGHEQVELGSENDDPDALERPLDRPTRVPGGSHGGPQPTVGYLRAVDLETAHLDLRSLHPLVYDHRWGNSSSCGERYTSKDGKFAPSETRLSNSYSLLKSTCFNEVWQILKASTCLTVKACS